MSRAIGPNHCDAVNLIGKSEAEVRPDIAAGCAAPRDIDIISFGDSGYNSLMKPALTAVHLDAKMIGSKAVSLLIEQLSHLERTSEKILVPTRLVIHETGQGPSDEKT